MRWVTLYKQGAQENIASIDNFDTNSATQLVIVALASHEPTCSARAK